MSTELLPFPGHRDLTRGLSWWHLTCFPTFTTVCSPHETSVISSIKYIHVIALLRAPSMSVPSTPFQGKRQSFYSACMVLHYGIIPSCPSACPRSLGNTPVCPGLRAFAVLCLQLERPSRCPWLTSLRSLLTCNPLESPPLPTVSVPSSKTSHGDVNGPLSSEVAPSHTWLLSTGNMAVVPRTEFLIVFHLNLKTPMWLPYLNSCSNKEAAPY